MQPCPQPQDMDEPLLQLTLKNYAASIARVAELNATGLISHVTRPSSLSCRIDSQNQAVALYMNRSLYRYSCA